MEPPINHQFTSMIMFQPLIFRGVSDHFFLYVFLDIIGLLIDLMSPSKLYPILLTFFLKFPFEKNSLNRDVESSLSHEQSFESSFALVFLIFFFSVTVCSSALLLSFSFSAPLLCAHQPRTTKAKTAHRRGTTKARTAHQRRTTKTRTAH